VHRVHNGVGFVAHLARVMRCHCVGTGFATGCPSDRSIGSNDALMNLYAVNCLAQPGSTLRCGV